MSNRLKANPKFESWSLESQDRYIYNCLRQFVARFKTSCQTWSMRSLIAHTSPYKKSVELMNPYRKESEFISRLYRIGKELKLLKISYFEFENSVFLNGSYSNWLNYVDRYRKNCFKKRSHPPSYYEIHGTEFRAKQSFSQQKVEKKELSDKEIQEREWKQKKRKDSGQKRFARGRKTYGKTISNRWLRREEKKLIRNKKWSDFPLLKEVQDSWLWD